MNIDAAIKGGQMIPVSKLRKSYDSVFVDANFMQPEEDHIVLFFFDERHNILSEVQEAKDVEGLLDTFAFNMKEELLEYGADSTRAYLLRKGEKRHNDTVMLSVVFICATEAEYVMSYEGRKNVLPGVYRRMSSDVQSNFKRRGGKVSLRRCISIANHLLGPDGFSVNILYMIQEMNEMGVPLQFKKGKSIGKIYNAKVQMWFLSSGFYMEEISDIITESIPSLGKDAGESSVNAYKAAVSDTIRAAFARFSFIVYKDKRYLCKNSILMRVIGQRQQTQREDIGINDLLLAEDDTDAEVVDEDDVVDDVDPIDTLLD